MQAPHQSRTIVWVLFLMFAIFWLYALGVRTLVPTDEGRYAEMAREMVATGDWITLRLDGIKYFEKPPLQTWMNALTFKLFGLGEWQARLWTGLCGLLGIVLVAGAGRKVFGNRVGFIAGTVLASCFMWNGLGHVNTLDMGLAAMMTLGLCSLLIAQRDDATVREQRYWMLVCWAGMALAVLSKGLIGIVLPGAVLVLYTLLSRDWGIWKRLHLGLGLLLFFLITVPWFVLISLKNPEFPQFFFIHEHFQRFISKVHHREGPWYYFLPLLIIGIFPWLGVLVQSLWYGRDDMRQTFRPKLLLLIWAIFIFVFFSISSSKLPSYIVPIFPALALLIACFLHKASREHLLASAALFVIANVIGLAATPLLMKLPKSAFEVPLYEAYLPWVVAGTIVAIIGGALSIWLSRRRTEWSIVALAAAGFLSGEIFLLGHQPLGRYAAGVEHVPAILAEMKDDTPLYAVGRYEQVMPFYLQHTLTLVQQPDELEFGLSHEPQLWLPTLEAFTAKWRGDHAAGKESIAIMRPELFAQFQAQGLPMRVIGQDPKRVVVTSNVAKEK
jgi:4-amino-4-deoxy-L-arabinose transferase-like glycosyltransferase